MESNENNSTNTNNVTPSNNTINEQSSNNVSQVNTFTNNQNTTNSNPSNFTVSNNQSNGKKNKKDKKPKSGKNIGKTIVVPFVSGVVGASLVLGVCLGVPSIKRAIFRTPSITTVSSDGTKEETLINIADYSNTAVSVAEKVLPSVVGIKVNYEVNSIFGGTSNSEATGSGIVLTEDGYIITNNHVVSSENSSYYAITTATSIKVNLYGDTNSYDATIIGTDPYTDLAVLKIEKSGLTPATLGNSNDAKVGEFVMAIGNPLGMDYSVTAGIISAVNREISSEGSTHYAIQTDAAINSGNSGGALVNAKGEVIGINTLKLAGNGIEGVGFAIPISSTTNIIDQLINFQKVKRPYIGITGSSVDKSVTQKYDIPTGVYVEDVEKGSPAEKAGIQKGDIITEIEGKKISSVNELNRIKYNYAIGDKIKLQITRSTDNVFDAELVLAELPEEKETKKEQPEVIIQQKPSVPSIFDFFN